MSRRPYSCGDRYVVSRLMELVRLSEAKAGKR